MQNLLKVSLSVSTLVKNCAEDTYKSSMVTLRAEPREILLNKGLIDYATRIWKMASLATALICITLFFFISLFIQLLLHRDATSTHLIHLPCSQASFLAIYRMSDTSSMLQCTLKTKRSVSMGCPHKNVKLGRSTQHNSFYSFSISTHMMQTVYQPIHYVEQLNSLLTIYLKLIVVARHFCLWCLLYE